MSELNKEKLLAQIAELEAKLEGAKPGLLMTIRRSVLPACARFCAVYFIYLALVMPFARSGDAAIVFGIPLSFVLAYLWKQYRRE
jgi:hypothetical protein